MHPQTSFFTKGEKVEHNGSYIVVNHCYVQYIAPQPAPQTQNDNRGAIGADLPILFVHGGGLTGSIWEVTPDRRPGWGPLAAREPSCRPVFLLDSVDHGRSQRAPDALRDGDVEHRSPMQMWQRFRFGPVSGFPSLQTFEGSQFPIEHLDVLVSMQAARRWTSDAVEARGLADAIKEIGPCDIVAHSHGSTLAVMALDGDEEDVRRLVRKIVLVEPAPPTKLPVHSLPPALVVWGDYAMSHDGWRDTVLRLGAMEAEIWDLPRMGVTGNSHFPMSDKNSDVVGRMILRWLDGS